MYTFEPKYSDGPSAHSTHRHTLASARAHTHASARTHSEFVEMPEENRAKIAISQQRQRDIRDFRSTPPHRIQALSMVGSR